MSNRKGNTYEREVMKLFENNGYHVVKSAGSHGEWDLVAMKITENIMTGAKHKKISYIALVQCKYQKVKPT